MQTHSLLFWSHALVTSALLLAACGGDVIMSASSGSASASSSGAGTSGSGGGSSSSSGGVGGAMTTTTVCGGFAGAVCPPELWCDYEDGSCGGADGMGICKPKPAGCDGDCPGVCGCDGKFYCNACDAMTAGVDTGDLMSCANPGDGEYSAQAWFGGLDHLFIRKADKIRNVCVVVHVTRPGMMSPEFAITTPKEWGVSDARVTNQASDCEADAMPASDSVFATGGKGDITWDLPAGKFFPCEVNVLVELAFPASEPWVSPTETLNANGIDVKDGCQ